MGGTEIGTAGRKLTINAMNHYRESSKLTETKIERDSSD